jgi:hypothetical protein
MRCAIALTKQHTINLGPKLGASLLTRHFGWKQKKESKKKRSRYRAAMVNAQRPCIIPSVHSAFTCLSLSLWMITGRVDCWCIKKHNIWHVTQRPPSRWLKRGKRRREVYRPNKFYSFSRSTKLQNCLQTVTLVIWWEFCNFVAANCICMQQCALNEVYPFRQAGGVALQLRQWP